MVDRKSDTEFEVDEMKGAAQGKRRVLRKSELKRQAILDAAAITFAEKGYAGTRLQDISSRIGTLPGAIYYHFDSKDQIVEEMLAACMSVITDAVEQNLAKLPPDAGAKLRIHTAIVAHTASLFSNLNYMRAYYRVHDQVPTEIRNRYAVLPRRYGDLWKVLLEEGAASGEIRSDLDLSVLRMLILGSITWTLDWYKSGQLTPTEVGSTLSSMVFEGLVPKPTAPPGSPELEDLIDALKDQSPEIIASVVNMVRLMLAKDGG